MKVLLLPVLWCASALFAQETAVDVTHVFENESIYEASDARHGLDQSAYAYKPRLRLSHGQTSAELEVDFRYDSYYQLRSGDDFAAAERDQQQDQFLIRNAWFSYSGDQWDLTVGKQILRWGYTTGAQTVLDVVNAQDRRSPFAQINDNPIGTNMVRFEWYGHENLRLSTFLGYDNQYDEVPVYESRYNSVPLPWREDDGAQLGGGARLELELRDNSRLALMVASVADTASTYLTVSGQEELHAQHRRYTLGGVSYLGEVPGGSFKADLGYTFAKSFTRVDELGAHPVEHDVFHGRAYYDYLAIPNLTLTLGYSTQRLLGYQAPLLEPKLSQRWYFQGERELIDWNAVLSLNLRKSQGELTTLGNEGTTATLAYTYIGFDNLYLTLAARRVFRDGADQPFENGIIFAARYTY